MIAGDRTSQLVGLRQPFGVDVDHLDGLPPLVAANLEAAQRTPLAAQDERLLESAQS